MAIGCPTTPPETTTSPTTTPPAPKTLTIGSVWQLSGVGSETGIVQQRGEELCKDWINAKGGITVNGEKYLINIITEDIKSTAEGCVTGAQKLVFQDKVKFILGLTTPFQIDAVASVTEPNKVLDMAAHYDTPSPAAPYTLGSYPPYAVPKNSGIQWREK